MGTEILTIPEEHIEDVVNVIRTGLWHFGPENEEVTEQLHKWCDEQIEYLNEKDE